MEWVDDIRRREVKRFAWYKRIPEMVEVQKRTENEEVEEKDHK